MRNRYEVVSTWETIVKQGDLAIQMADIRDKQNGHLYACGARRIIRLSTGKPFKIGKGGTVPWYGESAWSAAERALGDLTWKERFAR